MKSTHIYERALVYPQDYDEYARSVNVSILVVSFTTPDRELFSTISRSVLSDYAAKYGYDYCWEDAGVDSSRNPRWSKFHVLLKHMENPRYDWIVWVDDDIVITNPAIRLETFIGYAPREADLIIGSHSAVEELQDRIPFNSGLFFLKNNSWSKNLLREGLKEAAQVGYGILKATDYNWGGWDQAALARLWGRNWNQAKQHVVILHPRILQSLYLEARPHVDWAHLISWDQIAWRPGDFSAHIICTSKLQTVSNSQLREQYVRQVLSESIPKHS